jgi:hypothetical protein
MIFSIDVTHKKHSYETIIHLTLKISSNICRCEVIDDGLNINFI